MQAGNGVPLHFLIYGSLALRGMIKLEPSGAEVFKRLGREAVLDQCLTGVPARRHVPLSEQPPLGTQTGPPRLALRGGK